MKQIIVKIGNIDTIVTVVDSKSKSKVLTAEDIEMDRRVEKAVQTALQEAKNGNKPVAIYNIDSKTVTLHIEE